MSGYLSPVVRQQPWRKLVSSQRVTRKASVTMRGLDADQKVPSPTCFAPYSAYLGLGSAAPWLGGHQE